MMIGDRSYFQGLTKANLPLGWFPDDGPVINAVSNAVADPMAATFDMVAYVSKQSRLATATDSFLDLLALDYFGPAFMKRRKGEGDEPYRARLQAEMLRPLCTREAISDLVADLTGTVPVIFEPNYQPDTGSWGLGGWGVANRYGSRTTPFEYLIDVTRPKGQGIPTLPGWGATAAAWGGPNFCYASRSDVEGVVTDDEIMAAIARATPAGVTAYVNISS